MGLKGTDSCLAKAADDEPVFVLRASDKSAPELVRRWIARHVLRLGPDHPKVQEAQKCASEMEDWADANGSKEPD